MVLPEGIELSTSPLPRECSTTELRQRFGLKGLRFLLICLAVGKGRREEQRRNRTAKDRTLRAKLTRIRHAVANLVRRWAACPAFVHKLWSGTGHTEKWNITGRGDTVPSGSIQERHNGRRNGP
jgi:hypothetical protein